MKIVLVGPGLKEIPPKGWGAVEILIWDLKQTLEKFGHQVHIINVNNRTQMIQQINNLNPDFVHIQYDDHFHIFPEIKCKNVAITSHYGYLTQPNKHKSYGRIFNGFVNSNLNIFCLSPEIMETYKKFGVSEDRLFLTPNGVRTDLFKFNEKPSRPDTIYVAKIDFRKRQHLFQNIPNLYFAGNLADQRFQNKKNYLGEWNKDKLYESLTEFSSLALLSDGEAHPLVPLESMSAGLGLILSEYACSNLDSSKSFVRIVSEAQIKDCDFLEKTFKEVSEISMDMRKEIREYVVKNFSYEVIVGKYYLPSVNKIINKK